jgi:hypothetical protein
MKTQPHRSASRPESGNFFVHQRGFALIVTLSLMILLTVIAVGLLTLSSISLRASSQSNAMSTAQANARMALMLAIGDLQKNAGPDQRITARADILDENIANARLTGVWKSRNTIAVSPVAGDYDAASKKAQFQGWLVSAADQTKLKDQDFAKTAAVDPAKLWDTGTLGTSAPAQDVVSAGKVQIAGTANKGAYSWAVMDEGIKARINTPYDNTTANDGAKTAQLGSGERPGVEFVDGLATLTRGNFEKSGTGYAIMQKGVSPLNSQLAAETLAPSVTPKLKQLTHDLTSNSIGLFTDVTTGGLKEDFHLLCENNALPAPYVGKGIYASRLGIPTSAATSDPRWESLHQFSRLYRQTSILTKSGNVPVLKASVPVVSPPWTAATDTTTEDQPVVRPAPPPGVVLMPTIAKVQVVFTMLARDLFKDYAAGTVPVPETAPQLHNPWGNNFKGTRYDYMLHMLYTPVVTLHNPYNVALEFNSLKVDFINVPFALQVFRNGDPQTTDLVPLDQMYFSGAEGGQRSKQFGMTMHTKSAAGAAGSTTFKLLPGEVKLFSPYVQPTRTWANEHDGSSRIFFDYDGGSSQRAFEMQGVPGWRGDGIGFDLDWFCAKPFRRYPKETINVAGATEPNLDNRVKRDGCIPLQATDNVHVEFAPYSIDKANSKFVVKMSAINTNGARVNTGAIELNYEKPRGLQEFLLGPNGKMRYPKTGAINTLSILDNYSTQIKNYTKAKPFAIISAQGKSTYGGFDADKREGRHATKPWVFAHGSIGGAVAKVLTDHPANLSHEIDLIFLEKNTDLTDHLQIDAFDRGNFISGHTGQKGSKFGVMYDIPLAPVQSLASLNGANPGGSSGYLPRFAQPIGNSWASPMLPADKSRAPGAPAELFDHSFMLNTALYDRFYFSGLATQTGNFSAGSTSDNLIKSFSEGKSLTDPRISLHLPDSALPTDMSTKLSATNTARHTQVAAWQKMEGAFNINSTSVSAWKAMLASIHADEALYNKITGTSPTNATTALTKLPAASAKQASISRLRLPTTTATDDGAFWLGPRTLDDAQLTQLATAIVRQIRERGPFLSLSEFVNRQLGSGDKAKFGALQNAIELSGINKDNTPEKLGQFNSFSGYEIDSTKVASYNYKFAEAGTGYSGDGAPGAISQADILNVLGNAATARSDTFTIRAYGDARDAAGKITATAFCEAVVQRLPEYVDATDPVHAVPQPVAPATTTSPIITSAANNNFGRRFALVSFRWLAKPEI